MARPARSLDVLLSEVNALAPNRSKASDGWLGDPAHAARASRHNPNNAGVVCARDITHDPRGGCDIHLLARRIVRNPPEVLEYVISNGEVAKRSNGWKWQRYSGPNPHDKHAHFAVGRGPDSEPTPPYDDTTPWGLTAATPVPTQEDDMPMFQVVRPDAGPDKDKTFFVGPGEYRYIDNTAALTELEREFGAANPVNQVAWWYITQNLKPVDVDEADIAKRVLAGIDPKTIAAAIPGDLADKVADELAARMKD